MSVEDLLRWSVLGIVGVYYFCVLCILFYQILRDGL